MTLPRSPQLIFSRALFRARGEASGGIERNQMCRGVLKHMGGPDKRNRLFHGHVLAVDVACPNVTDLLLTLQIILRHLLHGDQCAFKVFYLPPVRIGVFKAGVENNEDQHSGYSDYVDNNSENLFHA